MRQKSGSVCHQKAPLYHLRKYGKGKIHLKGFKGHPRGRGHLKELVDRFFKTTEDSIEEVGNLRAAINVQTW